MNEDRWADEMDRAQIWSEQTPPPLTLPGAWHDLMCPLGMGTKWAAFEKQSTMVKAIVCSLEGGKPVTKSTVMCEHGRHGMNRELSEDFPWPHTEQAAMNDRCPGSWIATRNASGEGGWCELYPDGRRARRGDPTPGPLCRQANEQPIGMCLHRTRSGTLSLTYPLLNVPGHGTPQCNKERGWD